MPRRVVGAIMLCICVVGSVVAEGDTDARNLITVEGQGEVRLPPDKIVIALEVEERAASLADALAAVAAATSHVRGAATQHAVDMRDIDAADLRITPMFDTYDDARQRPLKRLGFRVQRAIVVTLRDLSGYEGFLTSAVEPSIVSVRWVSAHVEHTREHLDEARRRAVQAAREKARAVAAEIGQDIGRAVIIEVDGTTTPCCQGVQGSSFTTPMMMSNSVMEMPSTDSAQQQSLGLVVLTARVKAAFELN